MVVMEGVMASGMRSVSVVADGQVVGVAASKVRLVYSVVEVAELLDLSVNSVYAQLRAGKLLGRQIGSRWVIPRERFHAWLNAEPEPIYKHDIDRDMARAYGSR
jgi:excisionase family DNA binding protein